MTKVSVTNLEVAGLLPSSQSSAAVIVLWVQVHPTQSVQGQPLPHPSLYFFHNKLQKTLVHWCSFKTKVLLRHLLHTEQICEFTCKAKA